MTPDADSFIHIRKATLGDIDHLTKIERETFSSNRYPLTTKSQFRHMLSKGQAEIRIASVNNVYCGMTVLFFRKNSFFARLYSIAVTPDYQGGQVGKALFEDAEQTIKNKKLKGMTLEIRSDNTRHLTRYQSLGYKVISEIEDYYPDGKSCFKLKKAFT